MLGLLPVIDDVKDLKERRKKRLEANRQTDRTENKIWLGPDAQTDCWVKAQSVSVEAVHAP